MKSKLLLPLIIVGLSACGSGNSPVGGIAAPGGELTAASSVGTGNAPASVIGQGSVWPTNAFTSKIDVGTVTAGITPFIGFVQLVGRLSTVKSISFMIQPKPGTVSRPVDVVYSVRWLTRSRHSVFPPTELTVPVFGLYAGFDNSVSIGIIFNDDSSLTKSVVLTTAAYSDPNAIYDRPVVLKQRGAGSALGFDFFAMKSNLGTPVVVDTDGEIRWVGLGVTGAASSIFVDNGFIVGNVPGTTAYRLELDGSVVASRLTSPTYSAFAHNLDLGKAGFLSEVDTLSDTESTIAEFTPANGFKREWDFARLLSDYMVSQGDDPSAFVRHGKDWFHSNSATYDPRDDSVIVSSRENFVIKVDYATGKIIWILGDPTKYWFTFPSLRAKALTLANGGLYPIGQHATSITSDGLLMLINDGQNSVQQPAGAPAGESRTYTAVSAYSIDLSSMSATEVWRFDYGQTVLSRFCSSVYEAPDSSLLVSYALADNQTHARLVGLDGGHNVVFDFQYANPQRCDTSWNAVPVKFDQMQFP